MRSDTSVLFLDTARSTFIRWCLSRLIGSPRPFSVRFCYRGPKEFHNWISCFHLLEAWSLDLLLSWPSSDSCTMGSPGTFKLSMSSWWLGSAMHAKEFAAFVWWFHTTNFHNKSKQNTRGDRCIQVNNSFVVRRTWVWRFFVTNVAAELPLWLCNEL